MKSLKTAALLSLLAFAGVRADSNSVASANILGYTKITVPSNQLVLISTSFLSESNSVASLFSTLPNGSTVAFWSSAEQKYIAVSKTRSGWGAMGTNQIKRGEGVFLSLPVNVQTNFLLSGTVPADGTAPVSVVNGLALLSYPYPSAVAFTNTAVAKNALNGDTIAVWSNGWSAFSKTRSGWISATNVQIGLGQAFFYQSTTNTIRNETCPYSIN